MKKTLIGIFLITALILSAYGSATIAMPGDSKIKHEVQSGIVTVETDSIVVETVGNNELPFYFFWSTSNPDEKYKLQFYTMFEIIDTNDNGIYDPTEDQVVANSRVALSAFAWEFSDVITDTDANGNVTAVHFNMTSTSRVGVISPEFTLQIRNHLYAENISALKFDIVITNYTFKDDNAKLVLAFQLVLADKNKEMHTYKHQTRESLKFGDAYFETNTTAQDKLQHEVQAKLSYGEDIEQHMEDTKMVYLTYSHFNGDLVHDPVIGVDTGSSSSSEEVPGGIENQATSGSVSQIIPTPSRGELLATGLIAVMFAIAVPAIIYRTRKR